MLQIVNKSRKKGEFQFYKHQFVESAIRAGIKPVKEYELTLAFRFVRKCFIWFRLDRFFRKKNDMCLLIATDGPNLLHDSFPYWRFKIVPVFWDTWPESYERMCSDMRRLSVEKAFFTSSMVAEKVRADLGIETYWMPEGIDINDYRKGDRLQNRSVDLYEMGRQLPRYHDVILDVVNDVSKNHIIRSYYSNEFKHMTKF